MKNSQAKSNRFNNPDQFKLAADYLRDLFISGPGGVAGKGVELGVGALLARTAMRRLPVPFNFILPFVTEKVILKHGSEVGRSVLLKGLHWVKQATEEKTVAAVSPIDQNGIATV